MMETTAKKHKYNDRDSDSSSSISSFINLGDVGNTMNEDSSSDGKFKVKKNPLKRMRFEKKDQYNISDIDDSDCKIIEYKPSPKDVIEKEGCTSTDQSLCPNQLMDKKVQNIWDEDFIYYADNESEKDDNSNEKVKYFCTMHFVTDISIYLRPN